MLKLQLVDKHINKCTGVRRVGDWKSVLRELDGASTAGADSSPQVLLLFFVFFLSFRCDIFELNML